ncbi:hypothetical protein BH11MYX1_BH11MYX1_49910 [soil metagenome]
MLIVGLGCLVIAVTLVMLAQTRVLGRVARLYLTEDYAGARARADRGLARFQLPSTRFGLAYNAAGAAHHEGLFDECLERLDGITVHGATLQRHLVASLRTTTLLHLERDVEQARIAWAVARSIRRWKYDDAISALLLLRAGDPEAATAAFTPDAKLDAFAGTVARSGGTGLVLHAKRTRAIEIYWLGLYPHEAGDPAGAEAHLKVAATSGIRSIYATRARELLARAA